MAGKTVRTRFLDAFVPLSSYSLEATMKKTLLLACALLTVASLASAQQRGSLTLGWDDCRLAGGASLKTFACNTNTNSATLIRNLVGAYVAGPGVDAMISWAGSVDIYLQDLVVAPWWQHGAAPACRGTDDLSVGFVNSSAAACFDYQSQVQNGALGGQNYTAPSGQANHAQLRFVAAVDATAVLPPIPVGTETYLFNATIRNGNTVPTQAVCAGCETPACLTFTHLDIEQRGGDNFSIVYRSAQEPQVPALAPAEAQVTWQTDTACNGDPTPARNATWGSIKSIYR
jgi:hypothetical protein